MPESEFGFVGVIRRGHELIVDAEEPVSPIALAALCQADEKLL